MNGRHHEDLTLISGAMSGVAGEQLEALIEGAGDADYLDDVRCHVPLEGDQPEMFGRTLTSLQHFQVPGRSWGGEGYCWDSDKSLGLADDIADVLAKIAGATVHGSTPPMQGALLAQPGAVITDLRFPSADSLAAYWSTMPFGSDLCGHALHFVQDVCVPHHVWGVLLWGHQEFEDEIERQWEQFRFSLKAASETKALEHDFCLKVRAELAGITAPTVEELVRANASWTLGRFGEARHLDSCTVGEMLDSCIRAIAATMRAIQIMKGTP